MEGRQLNQEACSVLGGRRGFQFVRKPSDLSLFEVPTSVKPLDGAEASQAKHVGKSGKGELDCSHLPAKVLENCQRTARVIIISELEKKFGRDKKLKMELHKILTEFLPKGGKAECVEYSEGKNYYKSLNYSRVRIGHKQFIKTILNNSDFHKPLNEIFSSEALSDSQKVRKNERSPISFEERKKVLIQVLQGYKAKFLTLTQMHELCNETSTILGSCHVLQAKEEFDEVMGSSPSTFPLLPIPLPHSQYLKYLDSRNLTH